MNISREVQSNSELNLITISEKNLTHLIKLCNNQLLQEFESDKIIWSLDEKYLFYIESLSLYSYKINNQRKKKQTLLVSDLLKVVGNLIFAVPIKRNNQKPFSLFELNRRKIIRSFINVDAEQKIRLSYNRSVNIIKNQIFLQHIQRFKCHQYPHILYFDICTGQRLSLFKQNQMMGKEIILNHFWIQISNNGQWIGLQSQQRVFILNEFKIIVKEFQAKEKYKFSECSQYVLRYDSNTISQTIYVYDILNDIELEYMLEQELFYIKQVDKLIHTIQKQDNKMIYVKINL